MAHRRNVSGGTSFSALTSSNAHNLETEFISNEDLNECGTSDGDYGGVLADVGEGELEFTEASDDSVTRAEEVLFFDAADFDEKDVFEANMCLQEQSWDQLSEFLTTWNHAYVNETKALMNRVRMALLNLFEKRFAKLETQILWIVLLDPRLTDMAAFSDEERILAKEMLVSAAIAMARLIIPSAPPVETSVSLTPVVRNKRRMVSDFHGMIDRRATQEPRVAQTADVDSHERYLCCQCLTEVNSYLAAASLGGIANDDPLAWWKVNSLMYPVLSRLARKWLGCVSTSVPSERAFSTAGNIVIAKRCSL